MGVPSYLFLLSKATIEGISVIVCWLDNSASPSASVGIARSSASEKWIALCLISSVLLRLFL